MGGILINLKSQWQSSSIDKSIRILNRTDQKKIKLVIILQICMSALDLLGVAAIGLIGALCVAGLQSHLNSDRINQILKLFNIYQYDFKSQVVYLGSAAVFLLVGRTVLSILVTRKILFFLARRGAKISGDLISRLLSGSLLDIQTHNSQEVMYAVTRGVELIVLQVIGTVITVMADVSLLIVLMIGLFVIDIYTAIGILLLFSLLMFILHRFLNIRASDLGAKSAELNIQSNEKIIEVLSSFRESVVRNRKDYYSREIRNSRIMLSVFSAETAFMPYVSKYLMETSVVLAAVIIGAIQFTFQDAAHAAATLALFLAAGTRIAPAVLRVQQGSIQIRSAVGQAEPTFRLIEELEGVILTEKQIDTLDLIHDGFNPSIIIRNISLTYPNRELPALSKIEFEIPAYSSIAVVGQSGAGKTSLIDVILGVLKPDEGEILISNLPPQDTISRWPGAISYVPQDIALISGSIRENVALGYPSSEATDKLVTDALRTARLSNFVEGLPLGIDTHIGERGARLSGGQRQRVGIARAMFTNPRLLVLDEATSALDADTEMEISNYISNLRGKTTVVLIAHRLSTVRRADMVIYLSEGRVMSIGTFDEVRKAVPDFDNHAKLLEI